MSRVDPSYAGDRKAMIIIAVDPGEKRLGVAISDPTATIANPLLVIDHSSRTINAAAIARYALERGAGLIVVGQALDENNRPRHKRGKPRAWRGRSAPTALPVLLWDESGSTQAARRARHSDGSLAQQAPRASG